MVMDRENSAALREALKAKGRQHQWDMNNYEVLRSYDQRLVQMYCVRNEEWQRCRLSMKGIDTTDKLDVLKKWWDDKFAIAAEMRKAGNEDKAKQLEFITEIQVGNYLGALHRGGQLNQDYQVRKVL